MKTRVVDRVIDGQLREAAAGQDAARFGDRPAEWPTTVR